LDRVRLAKIGHHIDYKLRLAEGGEIARSGWERYDDLQGLRTIASTFAIGTALMGRRLSGREV
jgi:hypothetical protein